ncbi:hypothetical protein [Inquilinus sp. Marseille-Q2685]|uniref:hypothetical protein n=1 Tax=Inquilinus sp. Marseille-Q2685 TaxID=2866581 RepID=UPI001CE4444F|nr:hypothetical protein [Inquilinus sp. Marseille-Q2685]
MTPLRLTRRHALEVGIGVAGLARARVTIAPGLAAPDRAGPDDTHFIADRIAPPPEGAGEAAAILGRS